MKGLRTSLVYSLLMVFIPELMLGKAIQDRSYAKQQLKRLYESVPGTETIWTLQHFLYADMGGFFVATEEPESLREPSVALHASEHISPEVSQNSIEIPLHQRATDDETESLRDSLESRTKPGDAADSMSNRLPNGEIIAQVPYEKAETGAQVSAIPSEEPPARRGNIAVRLQEKSDVSSGAASRQWHINSKALVFALEENLIPREPPLTAAEIMDKSKSDLVSKIVAIFQISYFVIGVIARAAQHLPVSQLELGTCAFVPYAIAIYIAAREKPKSPRISTKIAQVSTHVAKQITEDMDLLGSIMFYPDIVTFESLSGSQIPNHRYAEDRGSDGEDWTLYLPVVLSIPFGAVHLAAWSFEFPTSADMQLWRVAAIVNTVVLPVSFIPVTMLTYLDQYVEGSWDDLLISAVRALILLGVSCFLVARLVIIVEMFRTLAYLAPGGYIATWTANVPHIG